MKKKSSLLRHSWLSTLVLVSILAISAFFRLYKIRDYMTYLGDEGRDVLIVKQMIVDHDIPFIGPTASVAAFFLGPLYYYLMAPFLFIFQLDPVGPAIMVALFGVATVYLLFRVARQWYGNFAAITASSLYALSPLVIAQSRSSWNPNIVPFFSMLYIYSIYNAIATKKKRWYFVTGACIGAGIQLHYLFLFLVPISILLFLVYSRSRKLMAHWGWYIAGVLLVLLPFLGFEIKNSFPNTRTIIRFLTAGKEVSYAGNPISTVSDIIFRLFARLVFFFPGSEQFYRFVPSTLTWWRIGIVLAIILSFCLLVYRAIKYIKLQDILLACWFIFGTVLFIFYQKAIYDYYLVIVFPLPFLMLGFLFERWWNKPLFRPFVVIILLLLLFLNYSGRPFLYTPNKQLSQAENTAKFVYDQTYGKPFNFALITGSNSDHAYRYFFDVWGNKPVTIENFEKDPERKTVTDQLLIICETGNCQPLGNSLWEIAGFGKAQIENKWQVGPLTVYKLVHLDE